ncbi:MAG: 2-succinyl-5-enolpyruvyl-6-hydroxy-3-cyclohexene-1-carboxylic-acid synthase [Chlorogloeopsis fritschii C42_A2020_084]|uniref:2-succinyl-5-enolpyruvyl-6-hydroxy-3- cyclohexene-1-carboxylic-acid synthase n=1 Tax=Chlorogloeopsis fritschii TaxID=1124 RepID=UPI0019EFFB11|nr:2-succinyl-5-enolpyruvyl-6-hydroxy-3-cyclohexene-1-carboxylic-acid synthase [Chlorogloeopsis fritschii]MBF2007782.1 2-succinyl-5-enolpyruvyl-6-hydroxy-3-cyclohexene-1-carboxylic-acid synthase [Chlorogloeopsis fritschii C42_A2020_084]
MPIGFRNTNELWASILTQTLKRLGLTCAVICPGSRSTPLAITFAQASPTLEVISILDERCAAFFALGRAKATGTPTAIVCTSGTAGANFYPAVIEAKESRVPLLLLTADRPSELRNCHSGQTIDQLKLYGNYPNWQAELAVPSAEMGMLAYLRQTVMYAWERALYPVPGPVHLNIPFRDPLAPIPDGTDLNSLQLHLQSEDFWTGIFPLSPGRSQGTTPALPLSRALPRHYPCSPLLREWEKFDRGIIIAGVAQPQQPQKYCQAIAQLSKTLKFPVLAEGLSPVRNYAELNPHIISTYDLILRNQQLAKQLAPEIVIQIGEMPTSPVLRNWLKTTAAKRWIIDPSDQNLDPLHGRTVHLRVSVEQLAVTFGEDTRKEETGNMFDNFSASSEASNVTPFSYLQKWCTAEAKVRLNVDQTLASKSDLLESKIAWLLSQFLPKETPIFIANSMPVRDVEFFWKPNQSGVKPFFNRGANGIDGTLSTALGIAHRNQSSVMLTGDLALLHDTNGFLIRNKFVGHLTIVLINNNGGGIFEMLPIVKFEPPFEEFFATPQDIDFAQLCATYGVEHELITTWEQFQNRLNPLPTTGIRVLELRTNRKFDAKWRQENLGKFSAFDNLE